MSRNGMDDEGVNLLVTAASISFLAHGGCQVNGPKVAKFLDR